MNRPTPTSTLTRSTRIAGVALVALMALGIGCTTAADLRASQRGAKDPRLVELDRIWEAIHEVMRERDWPVELSRVDDLLVSTAWMAVPPDPAQADAPEGLHRRVRMMILMAPMGMGINAKVRYARVVQTPDTPDDASTPNANPQDSAANTSDAPPPGEALPRLGAPNTAQTPDGLRLEALEGPGWAARAKAEEQALVQHVYDRWQSKR